MDLMEEKLESMLDRKFGPLKQSLDDVDHLDGTFLLVIDCFCSFFCLLFSLFF